MEYYNNYTNTTTGSRTESSKNVLSHLTNVIDYKNSISSNRLVVIDFYTEWCSYCKEFAPEFERISKKYSKNVDFYKVDCDEAEDIAIEVGITRLPTFAYCKNGKIIATHVGSITTAADIEDRINLNMR